MIDTARERHAGIFTLFGVVTCFLFSGVAALLYQIAWLREFALVFGTSELAVAAVLAAYMGGLGMGAALAARYLSDNTRPVLTYALLEGGIALSALLVPVFVAAASGLYILVLGGQPQPPGSSSFGQPMFYLFVAFNVLALPTGFMGATLPLLTRYAVTNNRNVAPRTGLLYGVNTLGAVGGAVLTGFILLPRFGLRNTIWIGVSINLLVFLVAALLARTSSRARVEADPGLRSGGAGMTSGFLQSCVKPLWTDTGTKRAIHGQAAWILPVIAISGMNAFVYEVLWTRLLSHAIGGSIYAFTTMLAVFLGGIAIGGGLSGYIATSRARAIPMFIICQILIAISSIFIFEWMGDWMPAAREFKSLALFAGLVMFPATLFIGATFPLAVRILSNDERDASYSSGRVYAWNTAGAIAGAIAAGFVMIPVFGFEGTMRFAALVNLALATWVAAALSRRTIPATAVTGALLLATVFVYWPDRPDALINRSLFFISDDSNTSELFFGVGRTSTVLLYDKGSYFELRTNGLPEATIPARGASPFTHTQRWLGGLPAIARPDAESMLVVGFGGGVALEGVPGSIRQVDVIELEPEIISANAVLSPQRDVDPLSDQRMQLIFNDARNALRLTDKRYDIIVSQPSHPWTAGASHLFTREFISLARSRLQPDGVLLQWMNAEFIDEFLFRGLAATLLAEFSNVRLYHPSPGVLLFLASEGALDLELNAARTGRPFDEYAEHYATMGINGMHDVLAALALDEHGLRAFSVEGVIITDDRNMMATRSRSFADGLGVDQILNLLRPHDPLLQPGNWIYRDLLPDVDIPYIGLRMLYEGMYRRVGMFEQALTSVPEYAADAHVLRALALRNSGAAERMGTDLEAALAREPQNMQALFLSLTGKFDDIEKGIAQASDLAVVAQLQGSAASVVEARRLQFQGDWEGLANLESDLLDASPSDLWYTQAMLLRARWRIEIAELQAEQQKILAAQALRLIDRVTSINSDTDVYLNRAKAAILLGDRDVLIDSAWTVVNEIWRQRNDAWDGYSELSSSDYAYMYRAAEYLGSELEADDLGPANRDEETLLTNLQRIMNELSQYAG